MSMTKGFSYVRVCRVDAFRIFRFIHMNFVQKIASILNIFVSKSFKCICKFHTIV